MSDPRIGTDLAGYRILALIGRGGMGVVYLGEHVLLGRRAAVKVIAPELAGEPEFRQRFIEESRMAASIDHPNIVPIYEAGEAGGALFLAMRYVEGEDLRSRVRRDGPLPLADVVAIVRPLAAALDAAHEIGLIHRDVKAANVLLAARDGHPFLTDFGITKRLAGAGGLTRTGQLVGTPESMAPEQIVGGAVDGRADQYALACLAYEALTGHLPHERDSEVATLFARINEAPASVRDLRPELPEGVANVLERALARSPEDRFADCAAFAEAFSAAAASPGPVVAPLAVAAPPPSTASHVIDGADLAPTAVRPGGSGGARPPGGGAGTRVRSHPGPWRRPRPLWAVLAAAGFILAFTLTGSAAGWFGGRASDSPGTAAASPTGDGGSATTPTPTPAPTPTPSIDSGGTPSVDPGTEPPVTNPPTSSPKPTPTPRETVPPVVTGPPTHVFVNHQTAGADGATVSRGIKVRVAWSATDAGGSGLASYRLERRQDIVEASGNPWTVVYTGTAASFDDLIAPRSGGNALWYTYRVVAFDRAGNQSAVVAGRAFELYDFQEDYAGIWTWSAGCSKTSVSSALGGQLESCSGAGETGSITITWVSNLAFVFATGAGMGSVEISVDGASIGTFDLSTGPGPRYVVAVRAQAADSHTITITVVSGIVQFDAVYGQVGEAT